MFFTSVAVIALIMAVAGRRPVLRLAEQRFHLVGILWLAIALRLLFAAPFLYPLLRQHPWVGLPPVGGLLYTASLLLAIVFSWANRHILGVAVIGAGLLMNAIVIGSNGGQMPVAAEHLAAVGQLDEMLEIERSGEWSTFATAKDDTACAFLGDWIVIPMPFKEPTILSPGDLVIAVGVLLFFLVTPQRRASAARDGQLRAGTREGDP